MSNLDYLRCETEMLRVEEHLNLLSAQYLIQCLERDSACNNITRMDAPPRMKKQTLYTKHHRTIRSLLSRHQTEITPGSPHGIRPKLTKPSGSQQSSRI